jgi:hypothetical protein
LLLSSIGIGSSRVVQESSIPVSTIELVNGEPLEKRGAGYPRTKPPSIGITAPVT